MIQTQYLSKIHISYIYLTLLPRVRYDTRSIFKQSTDGLNSEFLSLRQITKDKEPILLYYLLIARGRVVGFMPFSRVLV